MPSPIVRPLDNYDIINKAFTFRADGQSTLYLVLKAYYAWNPAAFEAYGGLHQNHATDPLHLSVLIKLMHYDITVHINGFLNGIFMMTDITVVNRDVDGGTERTTIAKFARRPLPSRSDALSDA